MFNKRAQGLPLSFIVIAAIAALILVLVIAFTIGGLGGFFRQIMAPAPEELSTVQTACKAACDSLIAISTDKQFRDSAYCKKTYTVDINGDGKIDPNSETGLHCYHPDIGISCTVTTTTGITLSDTDNCCELAYNSSSGHCDIPV